MADIGNLRRIMAEDFQEDHRQTVSLLAEVLNPFMQEIIASYTNNINFDNLNQEIITFKVLVDANGIPVNAGGTAIKKQVKLNLARRAKGLLVINAKNQDDTSHYPTANPFIDFVQQSTILQVNNIKGLQALEEYELTIIVIYDR